MMNQRHIKCLSSFFYLGFIPPAPGTLASAVAAFLCFMLHRSVFLYVLVFFIIVRSGFLVSDKMEKLMGEKDPGCIVIDEVAGVMLAFFLLPYTPAVVWSAFFLFRAFDMFKIYPADKIEAQGGSFGIMMDDLIAGLYTNVTMHIAIRLAGLN